MPDEQSLPDYFRALVPVYSSPVRILRRLPPGFDHRLRRQLLEPLAIHDNRTHTGTQSSEGQRPWRNGADHAGRQCATTSCGQQPCGRRPLREFVAQRLNALRGLALGDR